jgi:hypothetical protein
MQIDRDYFSEIEASGTDPILLDRHTPTGIFVGQHLEYYWVVDTPVGRRAITLTNLYAPKWAVITLDDQSLDQGFALGKPLLHLEKPLTFAERDDTGIIGIDDFAVSMHCCNTEGRIEIVNLGVYEPTEFTRLCFCGWRVFLREHPTVLVGEREPYCTPAEPFEFQRNHDWCEPLTIVGPDAS